MFKAQFLYLVELYYAKLRSQYVMAAQTLAKIFGFAKRIFAATTHISCPEHPV